MACTVIALSLIGGEAPLTQMLGFGLLTITVGGALIAALIALWNDGGDAQTERNNLQDSRAALTDAEQRVVSSLSQRDNARQPVVHEAGHEDDTQAPQPVPDSSTLTLAALWDATHARLKLYHDVALGQANRSFRSAQAAMWAGFLALAGFVALAFKASTTAGSIVAGGLGAVAAGLAGFISRTFVRSQENAAEHLRSYFDQPLEMARYLAAERLIAGVQLSEEQRAEVLASIVTAMVAGPQPPQQEASQAPVVPQQVAGR
ncbi:hypothetical protein ACFV5J_26525 [Streptomyces zaomyceticus]|uniref:hypothetical protein n=1 Tax=Streptomyces zaomyceticus TaxID=68286 RepID=UPI0036686CCE